MLDNAPIQSAFGAMRSRIKEFEIKNRMERKEQELCVYYQWIQGCRNEPRMKFESGKADSNGYSARKHV